MILKHTDEQDDMTIWQYDDLLIESLTYEQNTKIL